jgi:hypothetical protein
LPLARSLAHDSCLGEWAFDGGVEERCELRFRKSAADPAAVCPFAGMRNPDELIYAESIDADRPIE